VNLYNGAVNNQLTRHGPTKIMRVLLRNHGATLSGVKSNLYTTIGKMRLIFWFQQTNAKTLGIDSKHASGIPSTVRSCERVVDLLA
jgi:hypothetical protein